MRCRSSSFNFLLKKLCWATFEEYILKEDTRKQKGTAKNKWSAFVQTPYDIEKRKLCDSLCISWIQLQLFEIQLTRNRLTLTIVICFTHDKYILYEWNESERVYNQWKCSNYILWIRNPTRKCIVENVQGRSPQISINHSKALICKSKKQQYWEFLENVKSYQMNECQI